MSKDTIYREDAIKAVREYAEKYTFNSYHKGMLKAVSIIADIPSADRPQGHYIKGHNGEWYCSECKRIDDKYSVARFCWHCGARMKGADDE